MLITLAAFLVSLFVAAEIMKRTTGKIAAFGALFLAIIAGYATAVGIAFAIEEPTGPALGRGLGYWFWASLFGGLAGLQWGRRRGKRQVGAMHLTRKEVERRQGRG